MYEASFWREKLLPYTRKSNLIATRQFLLTLIPFVLLWASYAYWAPEHPLLLIPYTIILCLFILRFFVLMHDCGHGAMFASKRANNIIGFICGVITGMPQYVWSKNHTYHHNTNGDWVKYGGVFNIITTEKYDKLSAKEQRRYWLFRQPLILIPAGFFYVIFNPRFNWALGTLLMFGKILRPLLTFNFSEAASVADKWETKFWKGKKDYLHMTYNNIVLLTIWFVMCKAIGTSEFFSLYLLSTSIAGSVGILLFTIQHNFEGSYATDTARVEHYRAAIHGTSMLELPAILNWFTGDIAYHHLHHLSIAIPNYQLAACHRKYEPLFTDVRRFGLKDLLSTFRYQLWDPETEQVVPADKKLRPVASRKISTSADGSVMGTQPTPVTT